MNKFKLVLGAVVGLFFFSVQNVSADSMVDVSNNNGQMTVGNFIDMRDNYGVKSITTKISEGNYFKDGDAAGNIQAAQQAGLYINGYHFARYQTVQQAKDEADYACQTAKADGLPVGAVLTADVESSQQSVLSKAQNNANNQAFCDVVKLYGYRPDVYTMGSWLGTKMDITQGWIASYPNNYTGQNWYSSHHAWQYASDQQFSGSYGNFDISKLYDNYYTAGQTVVNTIDNVVTINTWNGNPTPMFTGNGDTYDTTPFTNGTKWAGHGIIADKNGAPMFNVGDNEYVLQRTTALNGIVQINYLSGYGPCAVDKNGNQIAGSNAKFKGGTKWATEDKLYKLPNIGWAYKVSDTEFIPVQYQVGSGFTG